MSILIDDCSAALVALPRPRVSLAGARLHVDATELRPASRPSMPTVFATWRPMAGSTKRGYEAAAQQGTQDGRTAITGAAHVTTNKHFSIRSGPPTDRPPA
jgi:hypothetical protein